MEMLDTQSLAPVGRFVFKSKHRTHQHIGPSDVVLRQIRHSKQSSDNAIFDPFPLEYSQFGIGAVVGLWVVSCTKSHKNNVCVVLGTF